MATGVAAHIFTRGEAWDSKLLLMSHCFAKLLDTIFSYFVKIRWMPSWDSKLLELLWQDYLCSHGSNRKKKCYHNRCSWCNRFVFSWEVTTVFSWLVSSSCFFFSSMVTCGSLSRREGSPCLCSLPHWRRCRCSLNSVWSAWWRLGLLLLRQTDDGDVHVVRSLVASSCMTSSFYLRRLGVVSS
jgi:hypothetical protein